MSQRKTWQSGSKAHDAGAIQQKLDRGLACLQRGDLAQAERIYERVLARAANHVQALHLLGIIKVQTGRPQSGLELVEKAIRLKPDYTEAYSDRGLILQQLGRLDEALASFDKAITLRPNTAEAYCNRGLVLQDLERFKEALASFDKAIALRPDFAEAYSNRGVVLRDLNRLGEALASFDKAIALRPDLAGAYNNRGGALRDLGRLAEALASHDRAIALSPGYADAYVDRGFVLKELGRLDGALASYERAIALKPDQKYVFVGVADCLGRMCDWTKQSLVLDRLKRDIVEGKSTMVSLLTLGRLDDPTLLRRYAENFVRTELGGPPPPLWRGETWRNEKIRVAYLSADFRQHPMSYLIAETIERHARARFEVLGISFGPDDGSEMRARVVQAVDKFYDVRSKSDEEIAKLISDLNVDIAVDLNGYTTHCRPKILMRRPAPVQVNYLGFTSTMGTELIDYIVADEVVLPFEQQPFYAERIVHLPDCYFPRDRRYVPSTRIPTRSEAGLPEEGFIFCCFNNNWKITPEVFDVWMRILKAVDGGVLWLRRDNAWAESNLKKEARARGVDPARLIFAPHADLPDHLARHRLADLFLDCLPYNAHTTASDALWAGLPVLTCRGKAFAGRVATSLLQAVGLPELITSTMADYEALATALARDPARLGEVKAKLARNRDVTPLFDTERFCRGLEAAYVRMWEIWQTGQGPQSFAVSAQPEASRVVAVI